MTFSSAASLALLATLLAVGSGEPRKITGPRRNLANVGFIQSYMVVDENNELVELGVEMDESLVDLGVMPLEESDGKNDILNPDTGEVEWFCCGHEAELQYPRGGSVRHPFDHFVLNWNPQGHGGPGYQVPHFDFHFYTMTKQERESVRAPKLEDVCNDGTDGGAFIPVTCEDFDYQNLPLPCDQLPPSHFNPMLAVEPHMGSHMLDLTSPEVNGDPFTHTWIFGLQGGSLAFWEPMITVSYFLDLKAGDLVEDPNGGTITAMPNGGTNVVVPIERPDAAPEEGLYPTTYTMVYDPDSFTFRVSLTDLDYLPATNGEIDCT